MDDLRLDGNSAAGFLQEVFAAEITSATGTCDGCGAIEAVGALVVYSRAPGTVVRCPHCDAVLMKLATDGTRVWIDLRGLRALELRPL